MANELTGIEQAAVNQAAAPLQYIQGEAFRVQSYAATHYLGVFALIALALAGLGVWGGIHYADKLIAKADARDAQYEADKKQWQEQIAANNQQILALSSAQATQTKVIVQRDQTAAQQVAQVQAPNQSAQDVADYSGKYLGVAPDVTADGKLAYQTRDVQGFITTKIDFDALQLNYKDQGTILSEETQKNTLLQGNITKLTAQNKESESVTKEYKAAAKASRWKKIGHTVEEVGIIAGTAYLAHKL